MQQDGYLSVQELTALRRTSKELGESPVRLLRSLNIASPEQIQIFLQKHFKVLILREEALSSLNPDHQIFIPLDIALHYSCFGIGEENDTVYIALEDPSDRGAINQLRFLLGKRVVGVCATVFQLAEGLAKIYALPVSNLKLTTAIEKSRGVVGGVRYHSQYDNSDLNSSDIDEDFAGVGLEDSDSPAPPTSFTDNPQEEVEEIKKPQPPAEQEHPTFDFIDGSSGDVDPKLFEQEKEKEKTPPEDDFFGNNSAIDAEIPGDKKPTPPPQAAATPAAPAAPAAPKEELNSIESNFSIGEEEPEVQIKSPPVVSPAIVTKNERPEPQNDILEENNNELKDDILEENNNELKDDILEENNNELLTDDSSSNDELIDDSSPSIEPELSDDSSLKISSIVNIALTKITMINNKEQAYEMLNKLLSPLEISVDNLEVKNKKIYDLLSPILKKIDKLNWKKIEKLL